MVVLLIINGEVMFGYLSHLLKILQKRVVILRKVGGAMNGAIVCQQEKVPAAANDFLEGAIFVWTIVTQ